MSHESLKNHTRSAHPHPSAHGAQAFRTLRHNEGAFVENRDTVAQLNSDQATLAQRRRMHTSLAARLAHGHRAHANTAHHARMEQKKPSPLHIALCMLALLVVCAVAFVLVQNYLQHLAASSATDDEEMQQVDSEASIEYKDINYYIREKDDGTRVLASKPVGGTQEDESELAQLNGSALSLFLYKRTLIIPENLDDGSWDVVAFTIGAGALPTRVVGADGEAVVGKGELAHASLKKDQLDVVDTKGVKTSIALQ